MSPQVWNLPDGVAPDVARAELARRRRLEVEGPYGRGLRSIPPAGGEVEDGVLVSQSL